MPLLSLIGKLNRMGYSGGGGLRSMAGALAQDPPFEGALILIGDNFTKQCIAMTH